LVKYQFEGAIQKIKIQIDKTTVVKHKIVLRNQDKTRLWKHQFKKKNCIPNILQIYVCWI